MNTTMTIKEAAAYIGVSERSVFQAAEEGRIRKIGRNAYCTKDIRRWKIARNIKGVCEETNRMMSTKNNAELTLFKLPKMLVIQFDPQNGKPIGVFESVTAAANHVGTSANNLSTVLHGRTTTAGGYHWKLVFIDDNDDDIY